jgi:hypothetical protein
MATPQRRAGARESRGNTREDEEVLGKRFQVAVERGPEEGGGYLDVGVTLDTLVASLGLKCPSDLSVVATDARTCDDERSHVAVVRDAGSFKGVHSEWLSEEEEGG